MIILKIGTISQGFYLPGPFVSNMAYSVRTSYYTNYKGRIKLWMILSEFCKKEHICICSGDF